MAPEIHTEARLRGLETLDLARYAELAWVNLFRAAGVPHYSLGRAVSEAAMRQPGANPLALPPPGADGRPVVYAAVRGKRHPVLWRQKNEIRHGIAVKDWEHFDALDQPSRTRAHVCILEAFVDESTHHWSGTFLAQSLARLLTPYRGFGPMHDTAFWPRDRFAVLATLTPEQLAALHDRGEAPVEVRECVRGYVEGGTAEPGQKRLW